MEQNKSDLSYLSRKCKERNISYLVYCFLRVKHVQDLSLENLKTQKLRYP